VSPQHEGANHEISSGRSPIGAERRAWHR
jgi:hypothetical protein